MCVFLFSHQVISCCAWLQHSAHAHAHAVPRCGCLYSGSNPYRILYYGGSLSTAATTLRPPMPLPHHTHTHSLSLFHTPHPNQGLGSNYHWEWELTDSHRLSLVDDDGEAIRTRPKMHAKHREAPVVVTSHKHGAASQAALRGTVHNHL